ncbi:hypothetical protein [Aeromonas sp. 604282]|uniref:hypothetical protein n=1 Tax=Aeromonas sp. 604282 TaxID=2712053 RepID=UPI003BA392CD
MTAITSLRLNGQDFGYASARYEATPRVSNGEPVSNNYILVSFDLENEEQATNCEVLKNHNVREHVALSVNGADQETFFIEENEADPVNVVRFRMHY